MGTGLSDLFKFKDELVIKSPKTGKPTKNKVWIRLMGDEDIKESYRVARIASASKRALLQDETSPDFQESLAQLSELTQKDLKELILAEAENRFITEAPVIVDREEAPVIEEIAAQPDAPQLEELEKLDKKVENQEVDFVKKIEEYVATKKTELLTILDAETEEEILNRAKKTLQNVQPLQAFADELNNQKGFRATFVDKECKIRGFADVDDFRNSNSSLKQQIIAKYDELDMSTEDIKE